VKRPGSTGFKAAVAVVRTGAETSGDWYPYRAQLANNSNKRLVPEILKPSQNQPLYITAKTIAAETPNMSAPFVASSGPSNRHDGVRSTSP
jgi:hypothetical protein